MKKLTLLSTLILGLMHASYTQQLFDNSYSNFGDARRSIETINGGYIVSGSVNTSASYEMALLKTDVNGNAEWCKSYGSNFDDQGYAVVQSIDGGYLLVGSSNDDQVYVKTDALGNVEWYKYYELEFSTHPTSVIILSDSNYLISGADKEDGTGSSITKIDPHGNIIWNMNVKKPNIAFSTLKINQVLELSNGNIMAVGENYEGSSSFGPHGGYILMLNPDGSIVFERKYATMLIFNSAIQRSDGNIVIVGSGLVESISGYTGAQVMQIDTNGYVDWKKSIEAANNFRSAFYDVAETPNHNLLLFGDSYDLDEIPSIINKTFIYKLDSLGNVIIGKKIDNFHPVPYYGREVVSITKTSDNTFVVSQQNHIKKLSEDFTSTCGLSDYWYSSGQATNPATFDIWTTKSDTIRQITRSLTSNNVTSSKTTDCATTLCTTSYGTDVVSACESYQWIDGNTYTASNNTATYLIAGGSSLGCDSLVSLDLTISSNNIDSTVVSIGGQTLYANIFADYQWLDCNNNLNPISGANSSSFTGSPLGTYAVEVNLSGCIDTSACVTIPSTVGLRVEDLPSNLIIYPNPSSGIFYLNTNEAFDIKVYNIFGKLIHQKHQHFGELNINPFPKGNYHIDLINDRVHYKSIIVKQ